jgi:intracellular multiplication protein IcmT
MAVVRMPSPDASWRDSARFPKMFIFDSRAVFPVLFFFLHITLWTFIVVVIAMIFFTLLLRFGFTISIFLRWVRSTIAGRRKAAIPWWVM